MSTSGVKNNSNIIVVLLLIFSFTVVNLISVNLAVLTASFISILAIYSVVLFMYRGQSKIHALELVSIVYAVLLFSALIICPTYTGSGFFGSDPIHYLEKYNSVFTYNSSIYWGNLVEEYTAFEDNNALYNSMMDYFAYIANTKLGGGSMMYYATLHVTVGTLVALVIFSIFKQVSPYERAGHLAVVFSLLSLFHIYSCICVRDIFISLFFLLAIRIFLKDFSIKRLLGLFLLSMITYGFRIYSGLFMLLIIVIYIFIKAQNSSFKWVAVAFLLGAVVYLVINVASSLIYSQSVEELEYMSEYLENSGGQVGLSARLYSLPMGIKQVALLFYSQFFNFPPFSYFVTASSFNEYYISLLVFIHSVFAYFVFYSLLWHFIFNKSFYSLNNNERWLFVIAIIFILFNTVQLDARRYMPAFFIFFYLLQRIKPCIVTRRKKVCTVSLLSAYMFLTIVYLFIS